MKEYKLGLALSGGSIKGFAHIGVLKYLDEVGVRPDVIAGTSAGSLVGAFYADGYTADEIFSIFSQMKLSKMSVLAMLSGGILDISPLRQMLNERLRHKRLEDLPTPLRVVATDFDRGEEHVFRSGALAEIVQASCSIPVLFKPVEIDGVTYVDGGLFRNFPASVIRDECDYLIGMNLGPWERTDYEKTLQSVASRSWSFIFRQNTLQDRQVCDVLLETHDVLGYGMFDTEAATELMRVGYEVARAQLTEDILRRVR